MSCRGKAMHALGECDCYFKPRDFLELPENERQWFEILILAGLTPGASPKYQVRMMLIERTRWCVIELCPTRWGKPNS